MTIKDPFIFNFVLEFKLLNFFSNFFFFFLSTEKQDLPHPLHPSIRLLLLLVFPPFCSSVILWLKEDPWPLSGNTHRTMPGLCTLAGGHFPPCWLSSQAPGWGTCNIPGEKLSPVIHTHENNSSLSRGLESAAQASGDQVELAWWFQYSFQNPCQIHEHR